MRATGMEDNGFNNHRTSMALPILHFVHANSFPSGTYRAFLAHLRPRYDVQSLALHAHDPRYPVTGGWEHLARELQDDLQARYSRPVILAGHSMGGVLSLMVAKAHPELVRCVLLLDAPVVAGWRALLLRAARRIGADRKFPPAQAAQRRRNLWPDRESAYRHYASRPVFARWPEEVLADYIEHGLQPHPEGVTLRFSREIESGVYRSLPDHIGSMVKRGFPVPVGFVGGIDSVECRQAGLAATRRLVGRHFVQIAGGHLFPMEFPKEAAEAAQRMIYALLTLEN